MRILLVASSSGGHVYIAKHFGDYLDKCGINYSFLGIKGEIEESIYDKNKSYFLTIPKSFKKSLFHFGNLVSSSKEVYKLVNQFDVIVGFGGFITFYISLFINRKKHLFYIHEANVELGDSNIMSSFKAKRIFLTFDTLTKRKRTNVVGNPVIYSINKSKNNSKISFVFGSLGSKTLLDKTISFLNSSIDNHNYLLITSNKYYQYAIDKLVQKNNIEVKKFIDRDELYSTSRIVFCRGGASTLMEILATKTDAVVIPSPYVKHNHQSKNANYLYSRGLIEMIEEKDYEPNRIKNTINRLFEKQKTIDNSQFKLYPEIEMLQYIKDDYDHKK